MKNRYIVQFETITNKILYIKNIDIPCVTVSADKAYIFTNKKDTARYAIYFKNYVISEKCNYKIMEV